MNNATQPEGDAIKKVYIGIDAHKAESEAQIICAAAKNDSGYAYSLRRSARVVVRPRESARVTARLSAFFVPSTMTSFLARVMAV